MYVKSSPISLTVSEPCELVPRRTAGIRNQLSPHAALFGWLAIVVSMNLTPHPLISGLAFLPLVVLALMLDQFRLVGLSLLVGGGMFVLIPGVSFVGGNFSSSSLVVSESVYGGLAGALWTGVSAIRLPAQVLAVILFWCVPVRSLINSLGRLSPKSALLSGLLLRLGPLLKRDVSLIKQELLGSNSLQGRRGSARLWEASLGAMMDRAANTASVLDQRKLFAGGRYVEPKANHRASVSGSNYGSNSAPVVVASITLLIAVIVGRLTGGIPAPSFTVFDGVQYAIDPWALCVGLLAASVGGIPVLKGIAGRSTRSDKVRYGGWKTSRLFESRARSRNQAESAILSIVDLKLRGAGIYTQVDAAVVKSGQVIYLRGASGTGKSTLLEILARAISHGLSNTRLSVASWCDASGCISLGKDGRLTVGYLSQDPDRQLIMPTPWQEIETAIRVRDSDVGERIQSLLNAVGLGERAMSPCEQLSSGERQRLAFAAAVAGDPDILLLDEPAARLDVQARVAVGSIVRDVVERGTAVVVTTHDSMEADPFQEIVSADHVWEIQVDGAGCGKLVARPPVARPSLVKRFGDPNAVPVLSITKCALADVTTSTVLETMGLEISLPCKIEDGTTCARHLKGRSVVIPDISIRQGELLLIEGDNGCGKTTLLKTLRGLIAPSRGRVSGGGDEASRAGWGWTGQEAAARVFGETAVEFVKSRCRDVRSYIDPLFVLRDAGLSHLSKSNPADASMGERQRLALACMFARGSRVLIMDEPFNSLDLSGRKWLQHKIEAHLAVGGSVVMSGHCLPDEWCEVQ